MSNKTTVEEHEESPPTAEERLEAALAELAKMPTPELWQSSKGYADALYEWTIRVRAAARGQRK